MASKTVELLDQALAKLDGLLAGAPGAPSPTQVPGPTPTPAPPAPAAATTPVAATPAPAPKTTPAPGTKADKKSEKKAAAAAAATEAPAGGNATAASEVAALFQKVLIKVARVLTVDFVENSEKLFKLTIDVGGGEVRQVCAGLRQFLAPEQLQGALVTAVCNLKPAKLAGNLSEAMLLAAEVGDASAPSGLLVRTLIPPPGSEPGDQVYLQGGNASTETVKQMKSDHWKAVASVLRVEGGGLATVDGTPLVTAKGPITLPPEIVDGSAIH